MTTNYWLTIYAPMTREHYERGGVYREVTYQRDKQGNITATVGRVLTLDEAVARRVGTIEIVFAEAKEAQNEEN